ncbi:aminopeptidase NAALADL1-like [Argonauta hians]
MATDLLSLDLATVKLDEEIHDCRTSAESNKLLMNPWNAVPATSPANMEGDNEIQQLLANSTTTNPSKPLCFKGPYDWVNSCNGARDKNYNASSDSNLLSASYSPLPISTSIIRTKRGCYYWSRNGCGSNSVLFLIALGILIIFLMGLLIGYYARIASHSAANDIQPFLEHPGDYLDTSEKKWICLQKCILDSKLSDFCSDKHLESIHGNIMYYINGNRMMDFIRVFPKQLPQQQGKDYDNHFKDYIKMKFYQAGLDKVEVHTYNVLVTSPNVKEPNYLEIVNKQGHVQFSARLEAFDRRSSLFSSKSNYMDQEELGHLFQMNDNEDFKGSLLYVNYGRSGDYTYLIKHKVSLHNQIVIMRSGKISMSKKISNAYKAGIRAVLLYTDPESNRKARWEAKSDPRSNSYAISYVPTIGVSDIGNRSLLVYNISAALALRILSTLSDTTAAPMSWWGTLNTTYSIGKSHSADKYSTLYLKFNSRLKTHTVSNVEGTLYGKTKPDDVVLVGSQRLYGSTEIETSPTLNGPVSSLFQMASLSSTAMLLELMHSLLHVRKLEGWYPQRTIKFYSWGTVMGNDDAGIQEYLKRHSYMLNRHGVGYVDLTDMAGKWCNHFTAHTDNIATGLILRAMNMVPDPDEKELSIFATNFFEKPDLPLTQNDILVPLSDVHVRIMSKWLPSAQFTCKYSPVIKKKRNDLTEPDSNHHFRYHMAVARVSSLVLLALSDGAGNEYSLGDLVTAVEQQVGQFVEKCRSFKTLSFNDLTNTMSKMLSSIATVNNPSSFQHSNVPPTLHKTSVHSRWLNKDCRRESLILHQILGPLTRLNDTSTTLESLHSLGPSLKTGSTTIHCSQPFLEAITTRLYQAWHTFTN